MRHVAVVPLLLFLGCGTRERDVEPRAPGPPGAGEDAGSDARRASEDATADSVRVVEDGAPSDSQVGPGDRDAEARSDAARPLPFDWVGILGTGQSLAIGGRGVPVVSVTQPYHNLKLLDMGPDPKYRVDGGGPFALVPLVEPLRPRSLPGYPDSGDGSDEYPVNIRGETPHSAMANQISALSLAETQGDYVTLHTDVGWGGKTIHFIDKGDSGYRAYPASLAEGRAFVALAKAAGKTFGYGAIILTHGEHDATNANYEADVHRLWADYNVDLKSVTGQTADIPLLVSQQSTQPLTPEFPASAQAAWKLGIDYPGSIVCIGPKYQYAYFSDGVHLEAPSYVRLGEKYAQVYYAIAVRGQAWRPLQPKLAKRSGSKITVEFEVPVSPLQWDPNMKSPHQTANLEWAKGKGFEVQDSGGRLTIDSVDIVGSTVEITVSRPPGAGLVVRYAMTKDTSDVDRGGTPDSYYGLLRDSDPFTGYDVETIRCNVTAGSTTVTSAASDGFARRTRTDDVKAPGLPTDTIIATKTSDGQVTLSKPWSGVTGTADLTTWHDQHNYAVQFELPVP